MPNPHVLIVSTKVDIATDVVVRLLSGRGVRVTRFNTEDFPFDSSLTIEQSLLSNAVLTYSFLGFPRLPLDSATSIWYRRIRSPERPQDMTPGVYDFCLKEARAALTGMVLACAQRIMSPPDNVWRAEHKLLQLSVARSVGLLIPDTVVTNDPLEVQNAFRRFGGEMIAKPVRTGFVDCGDEQYAIFTNQVLEDHLDRLEDARWSPVIYQRLIRKKYDVRVTVVGSKIFAANIDSQVDAGARIDWRHSGTPNLPHYPARLPEQVCIALLRVMERLGLAFGAIDLIRTVDDEYIFLEINPNGQWLWIDDLLGSGISEAVVDWLSEVES